VVLAFNPLLLYGTGFYRSIAAVVGILPLREPPRALADGTLLRPSTSRTAPSPA
jgi:hypothetical protein